ncbi:MAG: FtsX-like permease family protein [Proteobacteria bacterium]|nr:FtsX-like permease family protein [Pseudomonadota bacterium]
MLIIKLAFRNILGAGLRTWLNVFVLSLAFVAIIWMQGLLDGVGEQVMNNMIETEVGGGQYWRRAFDPYDPLSLEAAHGPLPRSLDELISQGRAIPLLMTSGAIYPQGRIQSALIKGIPPDQHILNLPTGLLEEPAPPGMIPAMIGQRMAKQTALKAGDDVTVRWRDVNGTFDATDLMIVAIMNTNVPTVDNGQVWIPLDRLREMMRAPNEATLVVQGKGVPAVPSGDEHWVHRDLDYLLKDVVDMIRTKSVSSSIFYAMLLGMALLAIFDTQVLAIFRRRREIGSLMALGMYRGQVIWLFTLEGALHGLLALVVGAVYGVPLMILSAIRGLPLPPSSEGFGVAISATMYPSYGLKLVAGTTLLILFTVTLVSLIPTRRIARLNPTDALRGRTS